MELNSIQINNNKEEKKKLSSKISSGENESKVKQKIGLKSQKINSMNF